MPLTENSAVVVVLKTASKPVRMRDLRPEKFKQCTVKLTLKHRRRIKTEEQAKGVAAVWGKEFIQFLAVQLFCSRLILKKRMNSSFTLNPLDAIHPILQFVLVQHS